MRRRLAFHSAPDYKKTSSICIGFMHGIGDFVMLTPALKKIKNINPDIRLGVMVRKELGLKRFADALGIIDQTFEMPVKTHPRFYIPWVFWPFEYPAIRRELARIKKEHGFEKTFMVYVQLVPTFLLLALAPRRARMHRIVKLAAELGVKLTEEELNGTLVVIPPEIRNEAGKALFACFKNRTRTLIGIQRNTMDKTRYIPFEAVQQFINGLNGAHEGGDIFFIVFADRGAYELEARTEGCHLEAPNLRYSFEVMPQADSLALAALANECDYILSVDSAVFNIAGALGKKTIGVFNNNKVRPEDRALRKHEITCISGQEITAADLLERFAFLCKGDSRFRAFPE